MVYEVQILYYRRIPDSPPILRAHSLDCRNIMVLRPCESQHSNGGRALCPTIFWGRVPAPCSSRLRGDSGEIRGAIKQHRRSQRSPLWGVLEPRSSTISTKCKSCAGHLKAAWMDDPRMGWKLCMMCSSFLQLYIHIYI